MVAFPELICASNGVLYYSSGEEVSLWGLNYYVPFAAEYYLLHLLKINHKEVMDKDFEHFAKMKVDVIRMHLFDVEISDEKGNLLQNEHLDLLDYLIKKCQDYKIYVFLTPIAWWRTPWGNGFSTNYSKPAMFFYPDAIDAQINYLKQLLNHVNPYSGLSYKDDLTICAFEVFNEPVYWPYENIVEKEEAFLIEEWSKWLEKRNIEIEELKTEKGYMLPMPKSILAPSNAIEANVGNLFRKFMYKYMLTKYIDTMVSTIKSTGAKQPVFFSAFSGAIVARGISEIKESLDESSCEGVTYSWYPGRWIARVPRTYDLLSDLDEDNFFWRSRKARAVYEFDAVGSPYTYVYPAFARFWKEMGTQIACMFAYDSYALAHLNVAWAQHFFNFLYTPGKAASFAIAREVYHRCERNQVLRLPLGEQKWDCFFVSHVLDVSVMKTDEILMYSNNYFGDVPHNPKYVMGVGSSKLIEYDGSGIYIAEISENEVKLEIFPDVIIVSDPWITFYAFGSPSDPLLPRSLSKSVERLRLRKPVAKIRNNIREFLIRLPWEKCEITKVNNKTKKHIPWEKYEGWFRFKVTPGRYIIKRLP
ncbi:MAG: hypothetical protein QXH24_04855 [Candidatus Bathyarchaeia archaeon]